ncbi:MAG: hypothetical protein NPIRA03_17610 [Nitrospirales bacterium]|nr:MAG: hypothetical protein NPIRA03_17610 [Nitrospirales bacterium]
MIDTESIERASEEAFSFYVSSDMDHSLRCVNIGNAAARALKHFAQTGKVLANRHLWFHQHRPSCPDRKGL